LAYRVKNWRQFQHYRDRNPPWIKLHFAMLSSADWVTLDDSSRVLAVACMLIASRNEGVIPSDPAYIKRVAYLNKTPNFKPLIECGFLEPDSDRKPMLADARPETETYKEETEKETERVSRLAVIPEGLDPKVWQDFIAIRKAKRSPLTQTALEGIRREASKAGVSLEDGLRTCCERGWQSLKAEWIGGTTEPDYSELIARLKD
jgi:hypothetical protein